LWTNHTLNKKTANNLIDKKIRLHSAEDYSEQKPPKKVGGFCSGIYWTQTHAFKVRLLPSLAMI